MEDSEIVKLFLERNEAAISAAEQKHGKRCRIVAANILNNREDAEDCVNECYLKLWNLIPPNIPKALGAYLCRIVKYTAVDMLKSRLAEKRGSGEIALVLDELEDCVSDNGSVENTFATKEIINKISEFLKKTPQTNRQIFILRYWYCCSVSDIAFRVGLRENNVSVNLSRTRKKLKEYLKKEGYEL